MLCCLPSPYTHVDHRLTELIISFKETDIQLHGKEYMWVELFISELRWYFVFNRKQHIFNKVFTKLGVKHRPGTQVKDMNVFYLWELLSRSDKEFFYQIFKKSLMLLSK
jgi:hypothetical protein